MLEFAKDIATGAGELLSGICGHLETTQIGFKGRRDLVTEADQRAERYLAERIEAAYPDDAILGEEAVRRPGSSGNLWIIDPLDGTTNFVHGHPFFCVSIARASGYVGPVDEADPVDPRASGFFGSGTHLRLDLGVVFAPLLGEMYTAQRGGGAQLGSRPIRVSEQDQLGQSLVATGFAYRRNELENNNLENFRKVALQTRGIRRGGSAALDLCFVAAGRFDAFWELYLKPWDVAAGMLLVQEAGGEVTSIDPEGVPAEGVEILASNGRVHDQVRGLLSGPDAGWVTSERARLFQGE